MRSGCHILHVSAIQKPNPHFLSECYVQFPQLAGCRVHFSKASIQTLWATANLPTIPLRYPPQMCKGSQLPVGSVHLLVLGLWQRSNFMNLFKEY